MARMYLKRGAACAWLSKFDQAIEDLQKCFEYPKVFTEKDLNAIEQDIEAIEKRKNS
jgi:hypothetical protein